MSRDKIQIVEKIFFHYIIKFMDDKEMSFLEHLEELRRRIIYSFIYIILFSSAVFPFSNRVIVYIARPVKNLYFFSPQEAIFVRLKISLALGIVLSLPFLIHQVYLFVRPALNDRERKYANIFLISSFLLFYSSLFLSFIIFIPFIVNTLLRLSGGMIPLINVSSYFSFLIWISAGFSVAFQFPVLSGILKKIGIIDTKWMINNWRFIIIFVFVFAAIITPTYDIITMLIVSIPLLILYLLSIISTLFVR